jgi:hypothetical protein
MKTAIHAAVVMATGIAFGLAWAQLWLAERRIDEIEIYERLVIYGALCGLALLAIIADGLRAAINKGPAEGIDDGD